MFDAYAVLLMVSGALLVLVGAALAGQTRGSRIINLLVGLAFFGYGFYLEFLFSGGHYFIFFYAFAVPVFLIYNTFKARRAAKQAQQQPFNPAQPAPQAGPGPETPTAP